MQVENIVEACRRFDQRQATNEDIDYLEAASFNLGFPGISALCEAHPSSLVQSKRPKTRQPHVIAKEEEEEEEEEGEEGEAEEGYVYENAIRDISFLTVANRLEDLAPADLLRFCSVNSTLRRVCENQTMTLRFGPTPSQEVTLDLIQAAKLNLLGIHTNDALQFRTDAQRCYLDSLSKLRNLDADLGVRPVSVACPLATLRANSADPARITNPGETCFKWPPIFYEDVQAIVVPLGETSGEGSSYAITTYGEVGSEMGLAFLRTISSEVVTNAIGGLNDPEMIASIVKAGVSVDEFLVWDQCAQTLISAGAGWDRFLDIQFYVAVLLHPSHGSGEGSVASVLCLCASILPKLARSLPESVWRYGIAEDDEFALYESQGRMTIASRVGDGLIWQDPNISSFVPMLLGLVSEQYEYLGEAISTLPQLMGPWMQADLERFASNVARANSFLTVQLGSASDYLGHDLVTLPSRPVPPGVFANVRGTRFTNWQLTPAESKPIAFIAGSDLLTLFRVGAYPSW